MTTQTAAFVGATGGAGTTRTTLECATLLARDGRDVAVLDAAYGSQGLADRTPGRLETDITRLCLDDDPLATGLVDLEHGGAGRLAVCPARAPFERLARAKTPEAAGALGDRIAEAGRAFDHGLVDTPPIAANQAVAAATTAERVAIVADADRAAAAVPRTRDRLADVGTGADATVVTRTTDHPDADATVPVLADDYPAVGRPDADDGSVAARLGDAAASAGVGAPRGSGGAVTDAVADVLAATLDVDIEREPAEGLRSRLSRR